MLKLLGVQIQGLGSLRAQGAPVLHKQQLGASSVSGPGKAGRPSEHPENSAQKANRAWVNHGRSLGGEAQPPGTPLLPGCWPVEPALFPLFFQAQGTGPGVGVGQDNKMPKGHVFWGALFDTSSAEFSPLTSSTQPRCKTQEQTLTRWPCCAPAKPLRGSKWWGALTPKLE